ncbi:uncharacterized protein [Montipora capricornis]|uniref:uncharacterized protein isoform X2 n=1 Tax=Montipora capricornis TaxID=246305 RepID=UPI0035F1930B
MPVFRQGHLSGPKGRRDFIGPDLQTAIADKSDAGWLVVQEYEQEELADDSEDEKRIKKAQEKACRRERQLASSAKKPRFDSTSSTAIATRSSEDRRFFKAIEYLVHPTYSSPVLTEVTGAHNAGVPSRSTDQFSTGKFSPTVSQISPIQDSVENDGADEDCFDEDQLIEHNIDLHQSTEWIPI